MPYKLACEAAGIGYSTFRDWMVEAEKIHEGTYEGRRKTELLELSAAVRQAQARGALTLMAHIWAAATEGSWQAALAILERRHKKDFSLRQEQQVLGGAEGGPVELTLVWSDVPPLHNEREDDTKEEPND